MTKRLGVALFGVGRAGAIHLLNLLRSERAAMFYVVERDLGKARDVVQKYQMRDTTVVSAEDTTQVYDDDRYCTKCTLPYGTISQA